MKSIVWKLGLLGLLLSFMPLRARAQAFDPNSLKIPDRSVVALCESRGLDLKDCLTGDRGTEEDSVPTIQDTRNVVTDDDIIARRREVIVDVPQDVHQVGTVDRGNLIDRAGRHTILSQPAVEEPTQVAEAPQADVPNAGNNEVADLTDIRGSGCSLAEAGTVQELLGQSGILSLAFGIAPLVFVLRKKK